MVKATREEADNSRVILNQLLDEVNDELKKGVSDPVRLKHLQNEKDILEKRLKSQNVE